MGEGSLKPGLSSCPFADAHRNIRASKGAYLPKNDSSYFMSTLQAIKKKCPHFLAIKNTWKFQIPWTFPSYKVSESRAPSDRLRQNGFTELWHPSPAAASGAPPLYLLGNRPFAAALALRVRPRARRACTARALSSC